MAKTKHKPAPGSGFDSHLLSIEETWWVRDHPFNARCVKVKRQVQAVTILENTLELERAKLDALIEEMNVERKENGA